MSGIRVSVLKLGKISSLELSLHISVVVGRLIELMDHWSFSVI